MREGLQTLRTLLKRFGMDDSEVPFRDFKSFRSYWGRNDAYGSWQARRDILHEIFDPIHDQLPIEKSRHFRPSWPTRSVPEVEPVGPGSTPRSPNCGAILLKLALRRITATSAMIV